MKFLALLLLASTLSCSEGKTDPDPRISVVIVVIYVDEKNHEVRRTNDIKTMPVSVFVKKYGKLDEEDFRSLDSTANCVLRIIRVSDGVI